MMACWRVMLQARISFMFPVLVCSNALLGVGGAPNKGVFLLGATKHGLGGKSGIVWDAAQGAMYRHRTPLMQVLWQARAKRRQRWC
jgi:hypothetical protein